MAYCDGYFESLMRASRSTAGATEAPNAKPDVARGPDAALENFQRSRQAGKMAIERGARRRRTKVAGVQRGLGPRVYVGFDAEWTYLRKGRNRIISVQFYMIGPTAEIHTKVIHLAGTERVEERPRLSQTLCDLLDEAMDEGVISDWPAEVVLAGFFTRADITVFSDFKKIRPQLQGVGGTLVTVGDPVQVELPMRPEREQQLKARYQPVVGDQFEPKLLSFRLVDASRLAPPGSSLATIGKWMDIPKIEPPEGYTKDEMDRFQRKEREKFEAYGLRDAEIAVMYVLWTVWFSTRHLGLDMKHLSATASGLAVRLVEACIRKDGVALDVALNYEVMRKTRWDKAGKAPRTQSKRVPKRIRAWLEPFLADTYKGGRNECFVFGLTEPGRRHYDPDLSGAYLSSLGYLFAMDYTGTRMTKEIADFIGHVAGFALVKFRFPAGTRFPCLPVDVVDRGLLFPLAGESLCTAPEIELALEMGAQVEILFGYFIPWLDREQVFARSRAMPGKHRRGEKSGRMGKPAKDETGDGERDDLLAGVKMEFPPPHHGDAGYRLFESFAIYIREMRGLYTRKTLPFEFVKLLGNSAYGKTGQGFKNKRTFGPREMDSVKVGPSRISEAAVAALVCGFIRAVIGEILWKLPPDASVVSATTDGFLVDRPIEALDLSGTMCRRFQALVDRLSPGTHMLENKHQMMQLYAGRTRLQVTTEADGKHPIVTAKGGVKPGPGVDDENAYMVDLILNRKPGDKLSYESFISMRDQLTFDEDLQLERRETGLNFEYDFKRRPIPGSACMVPVSGTNVSHLSFETEPWEFAEDGAVTRLIFDQWREGHCLKTLADWAGWEAFRAFHLGNRRREQAKVEVLGAAPVGGPARGVTGRVRLTQRTGYLGVAVRTFMSAYVQRAWGLTEVDMSQSELAAWLTGQGYPTKLSAVKNAGRSLLNEHVVPATAEVTTFLDVVKARFPGLERERFCVGAG